MEDVRHLPAPATVVVPDVADLADRVDVADVRRTSTAHVDSDDLVLIRWGVSLTHDGEQWRLELPPHDSIAASPLVHHWTGSTSTPPAAALGLLRAFLRDRTVSRVARVVTRRLTRSLVFDGEVVLRVHDDEVSVFHGRRLAERFREFVVEPVAPSAPTDAVVERLVQVGAQPIDDRDLRVRLLGPRVLDPPDVPEPQVRSDASAADVVRAAIADATRRLVLADPHARLAIDDEGVHQARVATRRLRSCLRTFRSLLDADWDTALRDELKWLGGALGAVRDLDVLSARLTHAIGALEPGDQTAARPLKSRLARQREGARQDLRAALDSPRYVALLDRLVAAAAQPALLPEADGRAEDVLPGLVQHPWKRLRGEVRDLDAEPTAAALHAVRIRAKRARYAAEAVVRAVGKPAARFARCAADLQTVLGDHQDAVVAAGWLREAAAGLEAPEEAFVAGLLAGRQLAEADRRRGEWESVWDELDRKKVRGWL